MCPFIAHCVPEFETLFLRFLFLPPIASNKKYPPNMCFTVSSCIHGYVDLLVMLLTCFSTLGIFALCLFIVVVYCFLCFSFTMYLFFGLGEMVQYVIMVIPGLKHEIHYAKNKFTLSFFFLKFCVYAGCFVYSLSGHAVIHCLKFLIKKHSK